MSQCLHALSRVHAPVLITSYFAHRNVWIRVEAYAGVALLLVHSAFSVWFHVQLTEWKGSFFDAAQQVAANHALDRSLGVSHAAAWNASNITFHRFTGDATDASRKLATDLLNLLITSITINSAARWARRTSCLRWRRFATTAYYGEWRELGMCRVESASQRIQEDVERVTSAVERIIGELCDALLMLIVFTPSLNRMAERIATPNTVGWITGSSSHWLMNLVGLTALVGCVGSLVANSGLIALEQNRTTLEAMLRRALVLREAFGSSDQRGSLVVPSSHGLLVNSCGKSRESAYERESCAAEPSVRLPSTTLPAPPVLPPHSPPASPPANTAASSASLPRSGNHLFDELLTRVPRSPPASGPECLDSKRAMRESDEPLLRRSVSSANRPISCTQVGASAHSRVGAEGDTPGCAAPHLRSIASKSFETKLKHMQGNAPSTANPSRAPSDRKGVVQKAIQGTSDRLRGWHRRSIRVAVGGTIVAKEGGDALGSIQEDDIPRRSSPPAASSATGREPWFDGLSASKEVVRHELAVTDGASPQVVRNALRSTSTKPRVSDEDGGCSTRLDIVLAGSTKRKAEAPPSVAKTKSGSGHSATESASSDNRDSPQTLSPICALYTWIAMRFRDTVRGAVSLVAAVATLLAEACCKRLRCSRSHNEGDPVAPIDDQVISVVATTKRLTSAIHAYNRRLLVSDLWTHLFENAMWMVPYALFLPMLFRNEVTLGQMMQTIHVYDRVAEALGVPIVRWPEFNDMASILQRLMKFEHEILTYARRLAPAEGPCNSHLKGWGLVKRNRVLIVEPAEDKSDGWADRVRATRFANRNRNDPAFSTQSSMMRTTDTLSSSDVTAPIDEYEEESDDALDDEQAAPLSRRSDCQDERVTRAQQSDHSEHSEHSEHSNKQHAPNDRVSKPPGWKDVLSTVGGDKTAMRSLRRAKLSVDFVRWTLEAIQAEQNAKSVVSHEMISRADSNNALRSSNALGPCAQSARVRYDSAGGALML